MKCYILALKKLLFCARSLFLFYTMVALRDINSYAPILYSLIHLVSDRCNVVSIDFTFYSVYYLTIQEGEQATKATMKI